MELSFRGEGRVFTFTQAISPPNWRYLSGLLESWKFYLPSIFKAVTISTFSPPLHLFSFFLYIGLCDKQRIICKWLWIRLWNKDKAECAWREDCAETGSWEHNLTNRFTQIWHIWTAKPILPRKQNNLSRDHGNFRICGLITILERLNQIWHSVTSFYGCSFCSWPFNMLYK